MNVKKFKNILNNALRQVERYPDDYVIDTHPNDYGLDTPVLQCYDGFVQMDDISASPEE